MSDLYNSIEQPDWLSLKTSFDAARPFPHLGIDSFLPAALANELEKQCRAVETSINASNGFTQKSKTALNDWGQMPPVMSQVCCFFNSGNFLRFLERVSGISGLIADPYLEGGGLHRTQRGGFLKLHTDFNWNRQLHLHRRINVLLYLNSGYQSAWDGRLLLTLNPRRQHLGEMTAIEPIANRLVIFNANDRTFHGHPTPHQFPEGYPRTSLAFYYYTVAPRPWRERRRFQAITTRYLPAIGEQIETANASLRQRLGYWLRRWTPLG